MSDTFARCLIAAALALATSARASADTLLVQSGQDSSPYAFTPANPCRFTESG